MSEIWDEIKNNYFTAGKKKLAAKTATPSYAEVFLMWNKMPIERKGLLPDD